MRRGTNIFDKCPHRYLVMHSSGRLWRRRSLLGHLLLNSGPFCSVRIGYVSCSLCFVYRQAAVFTSFLTNSGTALLRGSMDALRPPAPRHFSTSQQPLCFFQHPLPLVLALSSPGLIGYSQGSVTDISKLINLLRSIRLVLQWLGNLKRCIQMSRELKSVP